MRRGLWVAVGGVVGLLGGILLWIAICLSALALIMLLTAALDSQHGAHAANLAHIGRELLVCVWIGWIALWLVGRLRRR